MMGSPSAATSGQYEGLGRWIACAVPCDPPGPASSAAPAWTGTSFPLLSSAYLRCQNSSSEWTSGISSKLYTGGGDAVIHSNVRASHGSFDSSGRWRIVVLTTLTMNTRID